MPVKIGSGWCNEDRLSDWSTDDDNSSNHTRSQLNNGHWPSTCFCFPHSLHFLISIYYKLVRLIYIYSEI
ncbi:hypothetical protein MIR68_006593 [Amoeboaphelidium protococcarum]|nr:hypothetical protein MIR68_006593 [Amoeboaphelidium protococcarum]